MLPVRYLQKWHVVVPPWPSLHPFGQTLHSTNHSTTHARLADGSYAALPEFREPLTLSRAIQHLVSVLTRLRYVADM